MSSSGDKTYAISRREIISTRLWMKCVIVERVPDRFWSRRAVDGDGPLTDNFGHSRRDRPIPIWYSEGDSSGLILCNVAGRVGRRDGLCIFPQQPLNCFVSRDQVRQASLELYLHQC